MTRFSTKKLAITVLAAMAALLIAFGFMLMRPIAFADTVSTFKMEDGAAVRYGASKDENGIRFSARISKSEYETLTAGAKSVESGTFIMPAAYYVAYGAISEEACFGATNVYYYVGADGNFVGKDEARTQYKILNAVGVPKYIQEETAYAVFGSVVSILDANLNVPLIARSYLKITPQEGAATYLFADMNADINKNVRSVLSVSQNALLAGVTGAELDTVQGYFNKFVELNPDATAKYTEKYSIVDVSGKHEDASLTATRTAKITAFDGKVTTTVPEGYEGYKKVVGYEGCGSEVLKVGGATVLNSVIEKDNTARIIFDAENPANTNAVVSSGIIDANKSETWSWDGTKCAYFTGDLATQFGWEYSTPMALPYAADVFSFTVKSSVDVTLKIQIQGMSAYSTTLTDGLATIDVAKGVSKVYFVSDQPMKSINKVFMCSDASIQGEFAIDYFAYENGVSVNGESGNLSLAAEATAYDITAIDSTVFSGADLIENVTVSYLELNDVADEENEYTVVDKVADKYTLSVKGATSYIIKINVSTSNLVYEKKVYLIGDHGLLRESFEEGENSAVFSSQYNGGLGNDGYICSVTSDWALDGSNSMRISYNDINKWWCGPEFDTALTASDKCSYVSFWFFASSLANETKGVMVYFYTDNGEIVLSGVFKTGLHKYTVKTDKPFTKITRIVMSVITECDAYVDLISAGYDREPFVRAEGAVMDFEAHENGDHFGADNGYSLTCPVGSTAVSDEWSSDGDYSWKVTVTGNGWAYAMNSAPVTVAEYNTITFDIYMVDREVDGWQFYVYYDDKYIGGTANLKPGANRVTFTFENWSNTTFKGLSVEANGTKYKNYYIDRVVLSKV